MILAVPSPSPFAGGRLSTTSRFSNPPPESFSSLRWKQRRIHRLRPPPCQKNGMAVSYARVFPWVSLFPSSRSIRPERLSYAPSDPLSGLLSDANRSRTEGTNVMMQNAIASSKRSREYPNAWSLIKFGCGSRRRLAIGRAPMNPTTKYTRAIRRIHHRPRSRPATTKPPTQPR